MGLDSDQRHEEGGPRLKKAGEKEKEERKSLPTAPFTFIATSCLIPGQ